MLSHLATTPLTYIFFFAAIGFFIKKKSIKRAMYVASAVLALLFSNTALLQYVQKEWYKEYDRPLPEGVSYKYGIVLGGYSVWDHERGRPEHSEISDRLLEGIRLYKQGRIEKLLLASDGSIVDCENNLEMRGNPEGMIEYLKMLGVDEEDIILETKAWNTKENAIFTRELLKESEGSKLLITSALHMRRSDATFRKVGIEADCYITDVLVKVGDGNVGWWPSLRTLLNWQIVLHEIMGYAVYRMRGDI